MRCFLGRLAPLQGAAHVLYPNQVLLKLYSNLTVCAYRPAPRYTKLYPWCCALCCTYVIPHLQQQQQKANKQNTLCFAYKRVSLLTRWKTLSYSDAFIYYKLYENQLCAWTWYGIVTSSTTFDSIYSFRQQHLWRPVPCTTGAGRTSIQLKCSLGTTLENRLNCHKSVVLKSQE